MPEDIREHIGDIKEEVEETGKDVDDLKEDVDEIKEDVDDIKEEVEETGKDIDTIKREVIDSSKDVDEIKEHIKDIKHHLHTPFLARMRGVIPDRFQLKDFAQQVIGALIISAPFAVTEEVWRLASHLDMWRIVAIVCITVVFDILLFYFTAYQKIANVRIVEVFPLRIFSLLIVTYSVSAIMLWVFGVIGGEIVDTFWSFKLVVLVGLFANVGASAADLIR